MNKKTILIGLLIIGILLTIYVSAELINGVISLNLEQDKIDVLSRVGQGIGTISKVREICTFDNETETETCYNETYIDKLKLVPLGCSDGYCKFKLFEEGGINKPFKIKLESICKEYGLCEEFKEEYECCLEWRSETDNEVLIKAKEKSKEILEWIADKTLERESRTKTERFEEIEITI